MTPTTITWTAVSDRLPDDEECVLVAHADGDVWMGFLDAGVWRDAGAMPLIVPPTHWAPLPAGPGGDS